MGSVRTRKLNLEADGQQHDALLWGSLKAAKGGIKIEQINSHSELALKKPQLYFI